MTPRDYVAQRLGAFCHFNMSTFTGVECSSPDEPESRFAPTALDCGQWLDAVAAMGARYAILTAKHHDGFCLWPSRHSPHTIAASPLARRDVLAEFVTACRRRGVQPGLYFSVSDAFMGPGVPPGRVDKGDLSGQRFAFVAEQLNELLTRYGDLACLWLDGCWTGHVVHRGADLTGPARRLRALIKGVQPGCQVLYNWHRDTLVNGMADVRATEVQCGLPACDNVLPHEVCSKATTSHWFWEHDDQPLDASWLLHHRLLPTWSSGGCHLLNLAPDQRGLLPDATVAMCHELGRLATGLPVLRTTQRLHIQDAAWTFGPGWSVAYDQHGLCMRGEGPLHAEVRFTGAAFRLIGRKRDDGALLDLDLDGEPLVKGLETFLDLAMPVRMIVPRQIFFERTDLAGGEHVLGLTVRPRSRAQAPLAAGMALEAVEVGDPIPC